MASLFDFAARGQFCIEIARRFMLEYARMPETDITCKPTRDTFIRFGVVLAAFFGFGLYFFYDGSVGYRLQNEVYFSHEAFAALGQQVEKSAPASWKAMTASTPQRKQETRALLACPNKGRSFALWCAGAVC